MHESLICAYPVYVTLKLLSRHRRMCLVDLSLCFPCLEHQARQISLSVPKTLTLRELGPRRTQQSVQLTSFSFSPAAPRPAAPPCPTGEEATSAAPAAGPCTTPRRCSATAGASTAAASSAVSTAPGPACHPKTTRPSLGLWRRPRCWLGVTLFTLNTL